MAGSKPDRRSDLIQPLWEIGVRSLPRSHCGSRSAHKATRVSYCFKLLIWSQFLIKAFIHMLGRITIRSAMRVLRPPQTLRRAFSIPLRANTSDSGAHDALSQTLANQNLNRRVQDMEHEMPDLENLSLFNLESLSQLPPWFKFLEPVVSGGKVEVNKQGLPWSFNVCCWHSSLGSRSGRMSCLADEHLASHILPDEEDHQVHHCRSKSIGHAGTQAVFWCHQQG